MRRFWAEDLSLMGPILLDAAQSHHLQRVVHIRVGEMVQLFDGQGLQRLARVVRLDPVSLEPVEAAVPAHPATRLHLALALPKGTAMDEAVRMATEAGMTDLHPIIAQRTVATGDRRDRWLRIAESATQQCGRADVPILHPVMQLKQFLDVLPEGDRRIALPSGERYGPSQGPVVLMVGPEGGFTEAEVNMAFERDFQPMSLGRWILRSETAAAVAVAQVAPA